VSILVLPRLRAHQDLIAPSVRFALELPLLMCYFNQYCYSKHALSEDEMNHFSGVAYGLWLVSTMLSRNFASPDS